MTEQTLPLWYDKGLPFKCTGCGKCCTGSPGVVWISEEEIHKAAKFLNITSEEFCKEHVRKLGDRLALMEVKRDGNYDCTFLKGKQCTIYSMRPKQCKTFPWWDENLSSKEAWDEAAKGCEGINHPEASLVSLEEIKKGLS
jgi:uncharacterized protein